MMKEDLESGFMTMGNGNVEAGVRTPAEDWRSSGVYRWLSIVHDRIVNLSDLTKLGLCAVGIFVCYLLFGVYQEKVTRGTYGHNERFTYAFALVFVQCIFNSAFAKSALYFRRDPLPNVPQYLFAMCALTYVTAMFTSNKALEYVSYPTQVLLKACKPISVMLLGMLLAHKRYSLVKYLCVVLIVVGVMIFMFPDKSKPPKQVGAELIGEIIVVFSLLCDGLTGAAQERMAPYHVVSHQMMADVNIYSSFYLLIALIVTGEGIEFIWFVMRYPYCIKNIAILSVLSCLGQNFVFLTVTNFGPLTCSLITTTRKFITILFSVLLFHHKLLPRQWLAVVLVFIGLLLESYSKQRKPVAVPASPRRNLKPSTNHEL